MPTSILGIMQKIITKLADRSPVLFLIRN